MRYATRAYIGGGIAGLALSTAGAAAWAQEAKIAGVWALPAGEAKVVGEMDLQEVGPLSRELTLTYVDAATGQPVTAFETELTQELHILAADSGLSTLVHRHVEHATADGTFRARLDFPAPGLYHVYADAVPAGYGQQVLRFDVTVGEAEAAVSVPDAPATGGPLIASDGDYAVTLDASQLRAGAEGMMRFTVTENGLPADDLAPYLGVAAHAVFVRAEDLAYVHVHAMAEAAAGAEGHGSGGHGAHAGMEDMGHGAGAMHAGHAAPTGGHEHAEAAEAGAAHAHVHAAAPAATSEAPGSVSPAMSLHVTPPAPGRYALWLEFIGGGEVRTVPFTITIPTTAP